jgi:hypothetical protein
MGIEATATAEFTAEATAEATVEATAEATAGASNIVEDASPPTRDQSYKTFLRP